MSRCFTPLDAARAVVCEAKRLWLELDVRSDDITCIVVFVTGLSTPSKQVDLHKSVDMYSSMIGDWYAPDYVPTVVEGSRQAGRRNSVKKSAALLSYKSSAAEYTDLASVSQAYKEVEDDFPIKSSEDVLNLRQAITANITIYGRITLESTPSFGRLSPPILPYMDV